ncbi:MAG: DUF4159 domain-containing protein [Desulfobacteraceae bacterium]|nr:DUF4159 domain-containing protein [Desulfobacteraceae bacterium]
MKDNKINIVLILVVVFAISVQAVWAGQGSSGWDVIECANLIYAGTKSSVCFSDKFLSAVSRDTTVKTSRKFKPVKISDGELFSYPFAIMTGEGIFSLTEKERTNLKRYLERGGFLLASAGCSNKQWDESFRSEMKLVFPNRRLSDVGTDHPLFRTVHDIKKLETKGEDAHLEGITICGKLVVVYSPDGLNDTTTMYGCCCCGGNEIKNSQQVNSNIIVYALLQ